MPLPRKIHAVIFDMDGLIFDTEPLYHEAFIATGVESGHDISLEFCLSTIGFPIAATRAAFAGQCGAGFDFDIFWAAASKRFFALAETDLALKPGIIELLDALDDTGLPRAIATSSSHQAAQHHLALHGLTERFHAVVAGGDYLRGKPNPDPFLKAAERLGIDPAHCLALEDSHNGVRAASSAGMMTIMVPDLLAPTAEMENLCVRIAKNLHEVRALLG